MKHPAGSRRTLKNAEGRTVYNERLKFSYGFIDDTLGRDGDEIDVVLGPDEHAAEVYVIDMLDLGPDLGRRQNEDKVMLGFGNAAAAKRAFLSMYPADFYGGMTRVSHADFVRNWLGETSA